MMNAPLRPGTRPVGAAQLAVKDTSTNGPVFAATPKGDGPRPQDRRGGVRTRGAPFTSAQRSRILAQVVAHASAGLGKALAMRQQPPLPGLVVPTPRCRAPVARPILPCPRPTFRLSRSNVALATLAAAVVARRLVSRPARARALARLARLAARGPAPRSRTAPIRERRRGAAAAHTVVVVAPAAAHVVISHRRHAATPRVAAAAATPTCVAVVTAHVIVAHLLTYTYLLT